MDEKVHVFQKSLLINAPSAERAKYYLSKLLTEHDLRLKTLSYLLHFHQHSLEVAILLFPRIVH